MGPADIRGVEIAMLRTFDALMRERSVSRAAARLFLSQPAVSASLRRLRETFGDPLFKRTAHGVTPTERALALAGHVERVLAELALMVESGQRFDPALSQRIFHIAGSDHASRLMLPALATRLGRAGSGVRVSWETGSFAALGERLRKGDFDLAVLPRTQTPRDLESVLLYEDRYVLAARRGHPSTDHDPGLEAFCHAPQVVLGHGGSALDDMVERALQRQGRQRLVQLAVTSFSQMVDILARTDHLAVMPLRVAWTHGDRLQSFELPFELPSYRLFICWHRRLSGDVGVQWLRDELLGIVAIDAVQE